MGGANLQVLWQELVLPVPAAKCRLLLTTLSSRHWLPTVLHGHRSHISTVQHALED